MDYSVDRSDPAPPTVPRPALTARRLRPPRNASPTQVAPGPSIDSVPTVSIQHTTDAVTPAPPSLGTLPPEAPATFPETPSPAEIEFFQSVERYSHTDRASKQRAEPVCDATIRYLLLVCCLAVSSDDFVFDLAPHKRPPLPGVGALAVKSHLYRDDDGILHLVRMLTPPASACPDKPGGRAARLLYDEPTPMEVPLLMRPWIIHACHANASCHIGVARTPSTGERFCWWVGMDICTRW